MAGGMPLQPTYQGYINTTLDALVVFEACLVGQLNHVPRRPHDRERQDLIKSGNIFVYEEHASGIKRWTDSISWSPSRILGNYLLYRELDKPFPPGEKKRARGRKVPQQPGGVTKSQASRPRSSVSYQTGIEQGNPYGNSVDEEERALVGSLVDSYDFKAGGLIKKTLSVTYNGVPHHLVSYYTVEDVKNRALTSPTNDQKLRHIIPRSELMNSQNFRTPVEEVGAYNGLNPTSLYHPALPTSEFEPAYTLQGSHIQRSMSFANYVPQQLQHQHQQQLSHQPQLSHQTHHQPHLAHQHQHQHQSQLPHHSSNQAYQAHYFPGQQISQIQPQVQQSQSQVTQGQLPQIQGQGTGHWPGSWIGFDHGP